MDDLRYTEHSSMHNSYQAQSVVPSPMPSFVLYCLLLLIGAVVLWSLVGRLDVVAVAHGKLVPEGFMKIVQPAESGIVREILVSEGDTVNSGQVLMRLDQRVAAADLSVVQNELRVRELQLRRVRAELEGSNLARLDDDSPEIFAQTEAQYFARRQAHSDSLEGEKAVLSRAKSDLQAALEVRAKLERVTPMYRDQAEGWNKLAREGFAGRLMALERQRAYVEVEQDLRSQSHAVDSLKALIVQSEKRISQIVSNYRQQLQNERLEVSGRVQRLRQELDKQQHRHSLLELKAPNDGIVKDLATHTVGTVVSPGTVLLTLIPRHEPLKAEVWISNLDAGFVQPEQRVKVKLAAYPFQKYGMLDGVVQRISADATDQGDISACRASLSDERLQYRALVVLSGFNGAGVPANVRPAPGMRVSAEIHLGTRRVIDYVLSPIQKVAQEAGRER